MCWGALENTFRIDGTWPTSCKTPCVCFFFIVCEGYLLLFLTAWFTFFRKWEVKAIRLNSYPHAFTPVYQHAQERQRDDNRNHNRCEKWLAIVTYTIKKNIIWFSSYSLSNRKLQVLHIYSKRLVTWLQLTSCIKRILRPKMLIVSFTHFYFTLLWVYLHGDFFTPLLMLVSAG